jgi:hypothetical protein
MGGGRLTDPLSAEPYRQSGAEEEEISTKKRRRRKETRDGIGRKGIGKE